jgi:leucyl-tRNA synthetase
VDFEEPFKRLFTQGMIVKDGAKMSKSKGNVVSPDSLIEKYGADTVRLYTLFIGPPEKDAEWSDRGVEGSFRFIKRVWNLLDILEKAQGSGDSEAEEELLRKMHETVKKVTEDIDGSFHFNTAISAVMELVNKVYSEISSRGDKCFSEEVLREVMTNASLLLGPFVPHVAEELYQKLGHEKSVFESDWPSYDDEMLKTDTVVVPVQINGKVRATMEIGVDLPEEELKEKVTSDGRISSRIEGKTVRKWIIIPNKLINIVV